VWEWGKGGGRSRLNGHDGDMMYALSFSSYKSEEGALPRCTSYANNRCVDEENTIIVGLSLGNSDCFRHAPKHLELHRISTVSVAVSQRADGL
jgi:hypothetical protein